MSTSKKRLIREILQKIAPKIGATVIMEPEWNIAGQIIFKNGRKSYFKYSSLDINPQGSSEIAKDKDYAAFFAGKMGYPVVEGKTFFSKQWGKVIGCETRDSNAAWQFAKEIGLPVIVKPNSGSQGLGVFKVKSEIELYDALRFIFKWDRVALIQKFVVGDDYRVVVVDDKIISAYQRIPLYVIGDGHLTINQLIRQKNAFFLSQGRDTVIKLPDPRINKKLSELGLKMRTIPKDGQKIFLLDNANLSSGGCSFDVTNVIHPKFRDICIRLTRDMGLRFCGVDLIINGDISSSPNEYRVLEINSSPGLDHYSKTGKEQEVNVEKMYLEILKAMESGCK